MDRQLFIDKYLLLFIPWIIAVMFRDSPQLSYLIAWIGSFFIFYAVFKGWVRPLPNDIPVKDQLMRPIFITQIIFAGYMCCSSIFYFMDVLGYANFREISDYHLIDEKQLLLTAQCQRYYCLGHAAFSSGLLAFMQYPADRKYTLAKTNISALIFRIAITSLLLSKLFGLSSGLSQFAHQLGSLGFVAATLALALSIKEGKNLSIIICSAIYGFNLYDALMSGFKEPVIVSILILGIFLYPTYKRVVSLTFIPLLLLIFLLLPTYNRIFRQQAWFGERSSTEASKIALQAILSDTGDDGNWTFFTHRLSEIDMFSKYLENTPSQIDFYGTQLLTQSITAVIPRALWPSKPITEEVVMERVYRAGIVSRDAEVSAKPAFIADSYLSGGGTGIFILLFCYGSVCQLIANNAEKLFGGYLLGTAVFFTGLFQVFWRGQSFDFLLNTLLWSYISMYAIFRILLYFHILNPIDPSENTTGQRLL